MNDHKYLIGDVLMTEGGDSDKLGRGCIWKGEIPQCLHQNHVFVVRPHSGLVGYYLASLTSSDYGRQYFQGCSKQSTNLASINSSQLKAFPIPLPPVFQQASIVAVLSTWDRGIQEIRDLIAAKLRFKQGLIQQLLTGTKRLTNTRSDYEAGASDESLFEDSIVSLEVEFGITGMSFQEGIPRIEKCPDGWTQHQFRDLLTVVERPARIQDNTLYQLVTAKRYRGGIVPREQLQGRQIKTKTQFFIASGDFLISKRQIIHGACGMVPSRLDGALVSNEYVCLRPSDQLDPFFLKYLAHSVYFQKTCFHASVGVALEKMIFRLDQWLKHQVDLPPIAEQRRIAHLLSTLDREILLLGRQRRLFKEQKRGLMQRLLTRQ